DFASTVDANAISVGGNSVIGDTVTAESLTVAGTTDLGADVTTVAAQTYNGAVRLVNDVALSATDVNFGSTVNGNHRLVLDAVVNLSGDVGGDEQLSEVVFMQATDLGVDIDAGIQTYMNSLSLSNDVILNGDVTAQSVTGPYNLIVTGSGDLNGAVTVNDLSVNGDVSFGSTVQARAVRIAGNTTIADLVTVGSLEMTGTADLGADVTTSGSQTYNGAITLTNDVTLTGTSVTTTTVNGAHNLSIKGDADLNGAVAVNDLSVDGNTDFASTVDANAISITGNTIINDLLTADSLNITGNSDIAANVITFGTQTYTGDITLTHDVVLTGTRVTANGVAGSQNLTIMGDADLNGAIAVNDLSVSGNTGFASTVNAKAISVGGSSVIEDSINAESLTVTGTTDLGGDVTTVAEQTYTGEVSLMSDVNLTGSVISTGAMSGNHNLSIDGIADFNSTVMLQNLAISGNTLFAGAIDVENAIMGADVVFGAEVNAQNVTVAGNAELFGNVATAATQLFGGAVNISNDVTLSGSDILVGSVDGGHALTLLTNRFSTGDIGVNTALTHLDINSDSGFSLQHVMVNGDVFLQSNGDISGTQGIEIAGSLVVDSARDVNLMSEFNDFNTVDISARNASLSDSNSIILNSVHTSEDLTITSVDSIYDNGHISVAGLGVFRANNEIDLGSWGGSEVTRFGALSVSGLDRDRARKVTVIEDDSMHIAMGRADDLTLISELGSITADAGLTLDVQNNLHLEVQAGQNIGTSTNPIDFTFTGINGDYSTSTLSLLGDNAFITTQANLLAVRLNTSGSSVLFRSALTDTVLSASMIDFLNYLFGADEALFNEFVIIFDVNSDGIMLPEDQKDDIFAYIKEGSRPVGYIRQGEKFKQLFDLWQKYDTVFTLTVPQRDMIAAG
uniref:beta strand repeat-containing protein n=1 Tax=Amphritea sp. TaxID=1872502 RepID=UPI003D0D7816